SDPSRLETLKTLEDRLITPKGRYPQPRFIDQVQYLYGVISRADQLPGRDAYQRFEELEQVLAEMQESAVTRD
ncbi:MAG: hypothetical protein D6816_18565, partial [Bacteroidetes bacterium]